jgi:hypothetical protein
MGAYPAFVTTPQFCPSKCFQSDQCVRRSRISIKANTSLCPNTAPVSEQKDIAKQVRGDGSGVEATLILRGAYPVEDHIVFSEITTDVNSHMRASLRAMMPEMHDSVGQRSGAESIGNRRDSENAWLAEQRRGPAPTQTGRRRITENPSSSP